MSDNSAKIYRSGEFHWVGNGFPVRSVFGYNDLGQELSPFLLLDYAAPYHFPASKDEKRGVGGHPHRGFETVTIAYQGEIEHRDSNGGGGIIGPGDVQWMTAASGLVHEEFHSKRFTEAGGNFEMVQLWVNLPAKDKSAAPAYQTLMNESIPRITLPANGGEMRIIAGEYGGQKGPARTFTAVNLWDVSLNAGGSLNLEIPKGFTKAFLVLRGKAQISQLQVEEGDLVVANRSSETIEILASTQVKLLVLSGEPIDEPIVGYGPFVMNTESEIKQAFADFKQGKLGHL